MGGLVFQGWYHINVEINMSMLHFYGPKMKRCLCRRSSFMLPFHYIFDLRRNLDTFYKQKNIREIFLLQYILYQLVSLEWSLCYIFSKLTTARSLRSPGHVKFLYSTGWWVYGDGKPL